MLRCSGYVVCGPWYGFYPQNLGGHRSHPPTGTSLRDFTSFELSCVNIHQRVSPVHEPEKTSSSAVAKRPRDASCLSVVSYNVPTAQFLPRDTMHKRGLCRRAVSVCLSVRLSVTFVDHVKTNKHIFEIFSQSGSHTILVFPTKGGADIPMGTPLTGASNAGRNRDSGLIAGCRRVLDMRSAKNIYRRRS